MGSEIDFDAKWIYVIFHNMGNEVREEQPL